MHLSLTSYLIGNAIAVDGNNLGFALSPENLHQVRNVILTHTHIDHIASLPIFISEAFHLLGERISLCITWESIDCLHKHFFNNEIWPHFEHIKLLNGNGRGLRFVEIKPGVPFIVMYLRVIAVWTDHAVPTIAFAIEKEDLL